MSNDNDLKDALIQVLSKALLLNVKIDFKAILCKF
jgi:hypothetical protein